MVFGIFAGSAVTWQPTYARDTTTRFVLLPDGSVRTLTAGTNQGVTFEDGTVAVNDWAFDSARYLGAALYHESFHFEQNTTPGVGDVLSDEQKEIRAHSRSSGSEAARVFQLTQAEQRKVRDAFDEQLRYFRAHPGGSAPSRPFGAGSTDAEALRRRADSDFSNGAEAAAPLSAPYAPRPAGPTAPQAVAADSALPPESAGPAAPQAIAADRALTVPQAVAADPVTSEEVSLLAAAACRGDWSGASAKLYSYPQLSDVDLRRLSDRPNATPCAGGLLNRLIELRRLSSPLTLDRLQAETAAITTPPPDNLFIERESRAGRRPCVQRGVWFPDCY